MKAGADRPAGGTPREGLLYFSFEDERLADLNVKDLDLLVELFYQLNPAWRDARRATFFLDEVQLVPGWELFARRLLDSENIELFLSGSSARLLSREVATSMRGRAMEAVVFPFSFREMPRHAGREPHLPAERFTKAQRSQLAKDLADYLAHGGFPEAQGLDTRNRFELLRTYVDVVLLRDVVERHNLKPPQVRAEIDTPETLAREVRALQDAQSAWPNATLHIITLEQPQGGALPPGIQLHIATDWLLWRGASS